jgi:hypothetical protein
VGELAAACGHRALTNRISLGGYPHAFGDQVIGARGAAALSAGACGAPCRPRWTATTPSVRQPLPSAPQTEWRGGNHESAPSCRAMLAFLACPVLLPSPRTAVLRRLQLRSSGTRGCRVPCPIAMQLRMPEDSATIDALVEQTRQTSSIVVVYYADPSAFAEPEWSSSWGDAPEPSVRDDIVSRVANE